MVPSKNVQYQFIVGTNQWLYDTKACPATKVEDDDDLPGQIETQTHQSQTQTVQSKNVIRPTETYTVVDNMLKEHERDDLQTVDVNAGNGNEVAGGKDKEAEDQIQPQDSISNVQVTMAQVADPQVADPPLFQPEAGQWRNRPRSWLELLL